MQIEGGLGGESDITHGNGPGERHFDVISLVGDSVKEREKAVYVFIIDVVVEKHDENEAEGKFFLTVQEGLEKSQNSDGYCAAIFNVMQKLSQTDQLFILGRNCVIWSKMTGRGALA